MRPVEWLDRWSERAANLIAFWPLIPAGLVGAVTGYLSSNVTSIAALGPFGWWSAGLAGFLIAAFILFISSSVWERVELARSAREWRGRVDYANPLASSFDSMRLSIHDIAHPVRPFIKDKHFTNCQLVGPANIAPLGHGTFKQVRFTDCAVVVVKPNAPMVNVIGLEDCHFNGGEIIRCVIFVSNDGSAQLRTLGIPFLT